jgi:hypothetical protein
MSRHEDTESDEFYALRCLVDRPNSSVRMQPVRTVQWAVKSLETQKQHTDQLKIVDCVLFAESEHVSTQLSCLSPVK